MSTRFFFILKPTSLRLPESAVWPVKILLFAMIIALLAPLLANEKPLYVKYKGHHLFPALSSERAFIIKNRDSLQNERLQYDVTEWKKLQTERIIFAPIPYSPGKSDFRNADCCSPFHHQYFETADGKIVPLPLRFRHWLGTGKMGDDTLAGLIHGTRISLMVSVISMIITSLIGLTLGSAAGYFGDFTIRISKGQFISTFLGIVPAFFFSNLAVDYLTGEVSSGKIPTGLLPVLFVSGIFLGILFCFFISGKVLNYIRWFDKKTTVPVDTFISKIIELFLSIPRLVLIITLAAISEPSLFNLVLILSLTMWADIARLIRAEFLRTRELDFITAARALGYSNARIIFRHALPNGIGPVLVSIALGAAYVILAESGLSFLGIGVPQDIVTWGSLLASGKENIQAWWLVLFPGMAIFITVLVYNRLAESLRKSMKL